MIHHLKTWPDFFQLVWDDLKTFEYRKNDRDYKQFDTLNLQEFDQTTGVYSGREIVGVVRCIVVEAPGLPDGYCIMQLGGMLRRENSLHEWVQMLY